MQADYPKRKPFLRLLSLLIVAQSVVPAYGGNPPDVASRVFEGFTRDAAADLRAARKIVYCGIRGFGWFGRVEMTWTFWLSDYRRQLRAEVTDTTAFDAATDAALNEAAGQSMPTTPTPSECQDILRDAAELYRLDQLSAGRFTPPR